MILIARFFSEIDVLAFPACFLLLFFIIRNRAKRNKDPRIRMLYYRAFYFKLICVIAFTLLTEFYFKGGDTGLFYQATKDLRAAIADDPENLWVALKSQKLNYKSPLFDFFYYDGYEYDLTWNYMFASANFFPGKLALLPSYVFGNSYICLNLIFGFFALGGAIRLFKTFYHFYPKLWREIAFACLFLPSVCYWSSGLLKDPICFGSVGFIMYGFLNIFILKRRILISVAWILVCGALLYFLKVYILLVVILSLLIWQFAEFNRLIENKTLRRIFAGMTFGGSIVVGIFLLNYFTSLEAGQQYQLDKIAGNAEYQRQMYASLNQQSGGSDSYFEINTDNPVLMVLGGVTATFYRPFIWEINTPIAGLSALESSIFLFITLAFLIKKGVKKFFSTAFSEPRILMCFIFAFVFAVAVGTASANFGALSRYKIPCMPFYLIMVVLLFHKTNLPLPRWFSKMINFVIPGK